MHRFFVGFVFALAAGFLVPAASAATEIEVSFSLLERVLAEQVFTQEGRKYLKGSKQERCSFAYLEKPVISGAAGRLRIQAQFTGRSAVGVFGRCIGLGGKFDVSIAATPAIVDSKLGLRQVEVTSSGPDGTYPRRVRQALRESLEKDFAYSIEPEARRLIEQGGERARYRLKLRGFSVSAIAVTESAVVVTASLRLGVE